MSLVFAFTPAKVGTANLPLVFDIAHVDLTVDPNDGYDGGPAISGSSLDAYGVKSIKPAPASSNLMILGTRLKVTALPSRDKILLGGTTATGALIACVVLLTDGRLAAYAGNVASLLAVSADPITTSTDLRLGFSSTLGAGGAGRVEIQLDGETVAIVSGIDPGPAVWRGWYAGGGSNIFLSHCYGRDSGDLTPAVLCEALSVTNTELDDADPDGDTTVVTLAAVGDQVTSPLASGTDHRVIYGLQIVAIAKGSGTAGFAPLLTVDGTTYVRERHTLTGDYRSVESCEIVNPKTGVPWTAADITIGGEVVV